MGIQEGLSEWCREAFEGVDEGRETMGNKHVVCEMFSINLFQ